MHAHTIEFPKFKRFLCELLAMFHGTRAGNTTDHIPEWSAFAGCFSKPSLYNVARFYSKFIILFRMKD